MWEFIQSPRSGEVYNLGGGKANSISMLDSFTRIEAISGKKMKDIYSSERKGDVRYSEANISKITSLLNYYPKIHFEEGLKKTYLWYKSITK